MSMDNLEIQWLADLLHISKEAVAEIGIDEYTRTLHVQSSKNPFDVAYQS